ncbi:MAG: phosphodiester glycosidase family protein, partial [Williamsia herbipolensis]|nr:phosphodiester glycosidase family protein [Williamsia herbipolensis]
MNGSLRRRPAVVAAVAMLVVAGQSLATPAIASAPTLPLGARNLPETRTTVTVQRGVTVTTITRGVPDTTDTWTVEVASPNASDPDPDAPKVALTSRSEARATAATLTSKGLLPRVERVRTPRVADYGGTLGYRVRVGSFTSSDAATSTVDKVAAAGFSGSAVYTGWDGDAGAKPSRGTWSIRVVTIDPLRFTGRLTGDYGPDLYDRETTSALARAAGATVAVNAGFFVLDPAAGAPGDPAGVGVYNGRLVSETTNGRPALIVGSNARARVARMTWRGAVHGSSSTLRLSGLNRVPGLVRNCGAPGLQPTSRPQQDVTCTHADEIVAFDSSYGATAPKDVAAEVVLNARGRVTSVDTTGGAAIPAHGRVLQAIGTQARPLLALARHSPRVSVRSSLYSAGRPVRLHRGETIVNGGPQLLRNGRVDATPGADGMVHPGDPSFYYGWAHKRNPRTFAGYDGGGRLLLVTADGRSTSSLGLSISETARVARALGMRTAMNLDGGGSTTMAIDG